MKNAVVSMKKAVVVLAASFKKAGKEGVLKVLMVGGWAEFLTDKSADNRLS